MCDIIVNSQSKAHGTIEMETRRLKENNRYIELPRAYAIAKTRGNSTVICNNILAVKNDVCIILRKA